VVQLAIVIPTYNEVGNVRPLLEQIRIVSPHATVVVVDDGSPDGTADAAERIADELGVAAVVMRRDGKAGIGAAYRAGLGRAISLGADVCVQMDADLSHDPAVIPALVAIVEHGADLAIGSRYVPGGITEHWPWRRRALSRWGNRYAAGVLGLAVNDATAGFRAYRSQALTQVGFDSSAAAGFGFQVEMTHRLVRSGAKVVEFPITFRDRTEGESKMAPGIVGEALVLVMKLWAADFGGRRRRRARGA
jgi:glycosyltransferase involved in cell wall biosynthesis